METIDWLLDSDPAISWQVMRDLTHAPAAETATRRTRISHQGIGAQILAAQGNDGLWHLPGKPDWLPTLFTAQLLRATGADPADPTIASAIDRLERGFQWDEEFRDKPDKTFFEGEVEPCINGGILALGAFFGRPQPDLAHRLLGQQLPDGGWNCDAPPSTRSSFHTTICVLEGLLEYERATGPDPAVTAARLRAQQYLLDRKLFRRLSTGQVADPNFVIPAYPPRYHYDILRALDYLREAGTQHQPCLDEALDVLEHERQPEGRWLLSASHPEALAVPFPETIGQPSRWITLRALRVLQWFRPSSLSCH